MLFMIGQVLANYESCLCMNGQLTNWNDLRVFLAVADTGSLSGAARSLGVTHSTVFRRITAFEQALGVRLFERMPNGYVLTPAGEEMRHVAMRIEDEIAALERKVTGQDLRLRGTVRITTIDILALWLLPRHLARFREHFGGITFEVAVSNAALSLTKREADVALRIGNTPPEALVGRRVGRLVFAIYGARDHVVACTANELKDCDWIGLDSEHAALAQRFSKWLPDARPVYLANSVAAALTAAAAGLGLAALPSAVADMEPRLKRVAALPDDFTLDLWLLTHEDLRHSARIRAVLDFLADGLAHESDLLEGRRPEAWRAAADQQEPR